MTVENLPKHNDRTAIVMVKIDSFRNFPSRDRKEDCATPIITRLPRLYVEPERQQGVNAYPSIIFKCYTCFVGVGCFDENKFMFPHFIEYALCACELLEKIRHKMTNKCFYHIIPCSYNGFHVQIAGEECHNPVGHYFGVFDKDTSKISNNSWIIPDFESRTDGYLVTSAGYYLNNENEMIFKQSSQLRTDKG